MELKAQFVLLRQKYDFDYIHENVSMDTYIISSSIYVANRIHSAFLFTEHDNYDYVSSKTHSCTTLVKSLTSSSALHSTIRRKQVILKRLWGLDQSIIKSTKRVKYYLQNLKILQTHYYFHKCLNLCKFVHACLTFINLVFFTIKFHNHSYVFLDQNRTQTNSIFFFFCCCCFCCCCGCCFYLFKSFPFKSGIPDVQNKQLHVYTVLLFPEGVTRRCS